MKRALLTALLGTVLCSLGACNAPIDTELQLRTIVVKLNRGKIQTPAAAKTAKQRTPTVKRYSPEQVLTILKPYIKELATPGRPKQEIVEVVLETAKGEIHCQLFPKETPQTVANFVALATGQVNWTSGKKKTKGRFYDGLDFHRAITGFIIQTGNPGSKPTDGPGWNIIREKGVPARWAKSGVMGVVESGGDNHGSQFFITMKPARHLTGRYTPFGRCTKLNIVRLIGNAPKLPAKAGDKPKIPRDPVQLKTLRVKRSGS